MRGLRWLLNGYFGADFVVAWLHGWIAGSLVGWLLVGPGSGRTGMRGIRSGCLSPLLHLVVLPPRPWNLNTGIP